MRVIPAVPEVPGHRPVLEFEATGADRGHAVLVDGCGLNGAGQDCRRDHEHSEDGELDGMGDAEHGVSFPELVTDSGSRPRVKALDTDKDTAVARVFRLSCKN